LHGGDEVLLVDSSADRTETRHVAENGGLRCDIRYLWMPPTGVYAAQNRGIKEADGRFIQIINAGDRLCGGGRKEITAVLDGFPNVMMHVFRQRAIAPGVPSYVFSPNGNSLWPHQSIVVNGEIYKREGLYPEEYGLCAEQMYFARVRKRYEWKLHRAVLTEYLLGGRSSKMDRRQLLDICAVRRELGEGVMHSLVFGLGLPLTRQMVEKVLGVKVVNRIKCRLFSYYSRS
jgi:hypothetical protein